MGDSADFLFAVQLEGERLVGPKKHFFAAEEGEILFGMDLAAYGMDLGFQAVGFPGTRIARLDRAETSCRGIFSPTSWEPIP